MYQTVTSILLIATLTQAFVFDHGHDDSIYYNQRNTTACYGSIHVMGVHRHSEITGKVWFVPRYSRDTLEIFPRNTVPGCVFELGAFVIEDVTEEHVGEYNILGQQRGSLGQQWGSSRPTTPFTFLRLTVTECTDTRMLNYGDRVDIEVTVAPTLLVFYPANEHHFYPTNDTSKGIELWSSNKPSNGEKPCSGIINYECHWFVEAKKGLIWTTFLVNKRGQIWHVQHVRVTQKDEGMYVIRREDGRLIHKFQIFVEAEPIKPVDWLSVMKKVILVVTVIAAVIKLLCCLRKCCNSSAASSDDAEAPPVYNQIEEELMQRHPPNMMTDDSGLPSYEQIQHPAISNELMRRHPPNMMTDDSGLPSYEQIQHPAIRNGLNDKGPSYTMPSAPPLS